MNYRKFMKNSKAISPIFATLILIAIAVIAGVVVYMFTSGTLATMTGGGTAAQEKVTIQAASGNSTATAGFNAYAQNTGSANVIISSAIIKDSSGNVLTTVAISSTAGTLAPGVLTDIQGVYTFTSGSSYTITLVSTKGGNFVSPTFTSS